MANLMTIIFLLVFDIILTAILIRTIVLYGRKSRKDSFDLGVLVAFYWIENNTSCKDAVEVYKNVTSINPEDGIFYCKRDGKGRIKITKDAKIIIFEDAR